jgi:hypothetical protein
VGAGDGDRHEGDEGEEASHSGFPCASACKEVARVKTEAARSLELQEESKSFLCPQTKITPYALCVAIDSMIDGLNVKKSTA